MGFDGKRKGVGRRRRRKSEEQLTNKGCVVRRLDSLQTFVRLPLIRDVPRWRTRRRERDEEGRRKIRQCENAGARLFYFPLNDKGSTTITTLILRDRGIRQGRERRLQ